MSNYEYQCFNAPPDEEGWEPVGDCYATEEECAKECGPSLPCQPAYIQSPGDCLTSGFLGKYYNNLQIELITEREWTVSYSSNTDGIYCSDEDLLESWYQPEYSTYFLRNTQFQPWDYKLQLKMPLPGTVEDTDEVLIVSPTYCDSFSVFGRDLRYDSRNTPCHFSPDWDSEFCGKCFGDEALQPTWQREFRTNFSDDDEKYSALKRILLGERVLLPAKAECSRKVWCSGGICSSGETSKIAGALTGWIAVSMSCGPCWSCYRYNNKTEVYTANNNVHGPPDTARRIDDRCYETEEDAEEGCDGEYCCYVKNNGETDEDYQCVSKSDPAPPSGWKNTYQCTNDPDECAENCKPCWDLWRSPQTACRDEDQRSWFESPLMEYLRYEPKPGFEDNVISSDPLEGIPDGTNIPVSVYSGNRCDYRAEYQSAIQEECESWQGMQSMTSLKFVLENPRYTDNIELNRRTYEFQISGNQDFKTIKGECVSGLTAFYQEFRQPLGDPHPTEYIMSFIVRDAMTREEQGEVFYKLTFRPGFTMYRYRCLTKEQPDPNSGEPDEQKTWEIISECNATQDDCESAIQTTPGGRTMPTTTTTGPGTHLKNMLAAFGIKAKEKGCGCKSMEKKMNRLGNACTEPKNLQMIVDHLQAEAKKRHLPFVRKVGEMLVKRAVRKSQQNS